MLNIIKSFFVSEFLAPIVTNHSDANPQGDLEFTHARDSTFVSTKLGKQKEKEKEQDWRNDASISERSFSLHFHQVFLLDVLFFATLIDRVLSSSPLMSSVASADH